MIILEIGISLLILVLTGVYFLHKKEGKNNVKTGVYTGTFDYMPDRVVYSISGSFVVREVSLFGDKSECKIVKIFKLKKVNQSDYITNIVKDYLDDSPKVLLDAKDIVWDNEVLKSYTLLPDEFATLVKKGSVDIEGFTIKMVEGWDYKKALDVIVDSTDIY